MLLAFEDFTSWLDVAETFSVAGVEFEPAAESALLVADPGIMGGAGRIGERWEFLAVLRISID